MGSCYKDIDTTVSKSDPKRFYGGLNPFYSVNKGIADGIQKTMDNQTLQDVYNYIESASGHKSLGTVLDEIVKEQVASFFSTIRQETCRPELSPSSVEASSSSWSRWSSG